jgi:predicted lipoprotein with Yx(FWY)xxD motif
MDRKYALLLLVATLAAGCARDASTTTAGGSPSPSMAEASSPATTTTSVPTSTQAMEQGITIKTGGSAFGTMLYDARGQAIYMWELEESDKPECYRDCAEAWPPVLTEAAPVATGDVKPSLLGTTRRLDGAVQVTYAGHPLYYYAHEGPNEVKCHNVATHGGLWWVVTPSGNPAD